jgi:hypothetical protein
MSTPMHEFEFESEWESEGEFEYEGEDEGEYEGEEFFGRLASLARRAAHNPMLRRVGLQAARSALGGLRGMGPAGGIAARAIGGFLPQREYEGEGEYELESEFESFVNPQSRLSREALMAHLGNAAASAESEDEAEAFIGALIPLAAQLIPRVAPAVMRAAPQLIRGISNVTQRLRNNPATQQLVRTLPTVARNTIGSLARQAARGRPITPQAAVRTLAQQTSRVIGNPRQATQAYRRNRALDRRYHRVVARPGGAAGAARGSYGAVPGGGVGGYAGGPAGGGFDPSGLGGGGGFDPGGFDAGGGYDGGGMDAGGGFSGGGYGDGGAGGGGFDAGAEGMW